MKILVNGNVKELELTDPTNGCNWEEDLIGSSFDDYDDDLEMYKMEQETFDWWSNYITVEKNLQDRVKNLKDMLDYDDSEKLQRELIEAGDSDIEMMQMSQIQVVEEYELQCE